MTWTVPSDAGRIVTKLALAGALLATPVVVLGGPAFAAPGAAQTVLPAPPPAEPQTETPGQPMRQGEYYNPDDANDWWYNHSADGGGGGGGG